jgi:hypothetical protein
MKFAAAAAILAAAALSGCSTISDIFGPSTQTIAVTTTPEGGADCTLSSKSGSWSVTTPGKAAVAGDDDIDVRCSKHGWLDGRTTISADFDIWSLGDSYPDSVEVQMTPAPRATAPDFGPSSAPAAPYNPGLSGG